MLFELGDSIGFDIDLVPLTFGRGLGASCVIVEEAVEKSLALSGGSWEDLSADEVPTSFLGIGAILSSESPRFGTFVIGAPGREGFDPTESNESPLFRDSCDGRGEPDPFSVAPLIEVPTVPFVISVGVDLRLSLSCDNSGLRS